MKLFHKIILIFFLTAASVGATFITPELLELKKLFSIDEASLSYIMTTYLAGYLIGQMVFSIYSKRYGSGLSITQGFIVALLGFAIQLLALNKINYSLFLSGRLLSAFGLSSGLVCGFAIIKDNIEKNDEKSYFSIIAVTFTGFIYFSICLSAMLIKYFDVIFIVKNEIYYIMVLLIFSFFLPDTKNNISNKKIIYNHYINKALVSYSLVLSITTIIAYCYAFYAPLIIIKHYELSPQSYGYYNLLNMFGLFLGSFLYCKINKIIKEQYFLIICLSALLFFNACLLIAFSKNLLAFHHFIFIFFLINIISGSIYPAATFKSLEYGTCKKSSSATMNIIKIAMPNIALYCSAFFGNFFVGFTGTIVIFSTLFLILLLTNFRRPNQFV